MVRFLSARFLAQALFFIVYESIVSKLPNFARKSIQLST